MPRVTGPSSRTSTLWMIVALVLALALLSTLLALAFSLAILAFPTVMARWPA